VDIKRTGRQSVDWIYLSLGLPSVPSVSCSPSKVCLDFYRFPVRVA
jgi:hypothetical protein